MTTTAQIIFCFVVYILGAVFAAGRTDNQWIFDGDVKATRKFDGTSCAIIGGKLHKRYDVKLSRKTLAETPVKVGRRRFG